MSSVFRFKILFFPSLVFYLSAQTAVAEEKFCGDVSGINQIKTYLSCQNQASFAACSGLAAAVASGAGGAAARRMLAKTLDQSLDGLEARLASHLHDEWRNGRQRVDGHALFRELEKKMDRMELAMRRSNPNDIELKKQFDELAHSLGRLTETLKAEAPDKFHPGRDYEYRHILNRPLPPAEPIMIYEPRIKMVDGRAYDIANLRYDQLPDQFKAENRESAKVAVEEIRKRLASGQPLNSQFVEDASSKIHDEWIKRNGSWAPPEQKVPFHKLSQVEADKDRVIIQKAIEMYGERAGEKAVGAVAGGSMVGLLAKLGPKSALVLGGAVGAGAWLAGEALDATVVGCADARGEYTNQKAGCEAILEVDQNVAKFLDMPESEQVKIMRQYPKVCEYYKSLHAKLLTPPKSIEVSCESSNKTVIGGIGGDGARFEYRVTSRQDGSIAQINTKRNNQSSGVFRLLADGSPRGGDVGTRDAAHSFAQVKLYTAEAHRCCQKSGTEQVSCLNGYSAPYNGQTSPASGENGGPARR